jgi:hypothetical protein
LDAPDPRLAQLRGPTPPARHNARTIAALTSNPGCSRRAVLDTAGVDKDALARQVGFPAPFGQSRFAITRGNAFEAQVKENGCAELLRLLRETLGLAVEEAAYADLEDVGGNAGLEVRRVHTEKLLARGSGCTLFDHPLLRLPIAGQYVYLEPDLVAFQHGEVHHVVEIKSFPVIDGQADPGKVAAAAIQSAVYVLALRRLLGDDAVSHEVVLVCPKDFSNRPVAALIDVRKQLLILEHQLGRLRRVEELLDELPPGFNLDVARPAEELAGQLALLDARYSPDCIASCDLGFFCRNEAAGRTATLGTGVREQLGGVESVRTALGIARDGWPVTEEHAEAAAMLRATARLYAEVRE